MKVRAIILEQLLSHLVWLEEEAGNIALAVNYWEQVKVLTPERDSLQARIDELRRKQSPVHPSP